MEVISTAMPDSPSSMTRWRECAGLRACRRADLGTRRDDASRLGILASEIWCLCVTARESVKFWCALLNLVEWDRGYRMRFFSREPDGPDHRETVTSCKNVGVTGYHRSQRYASALAGAAGATESLWWTTPRNHIILVGLDANANHPANKHQSGPRTRDTLTALKGRCSSVLLPSRGDVVLEEAPAAEARGSSAQQSRAMSELCLVRKGVERSW